MDKDKFTHIQEKGRDMKDRKKYVTYNMRFSANIEMKMLKTTKPNKRIDEILPQVPKKPTK